MKNNRLKKYLEISKDPNLAILKILESAEAQMKAMMETKMSEMEAKHKAEMKEITLAIKDELKREIPDYSSVIEKIKGIDGNDGVDSNPEEVADIIFNMPEFIELTKAKDGHTPTNEELLALIRPLIPTISDEKLISLIKPLIPTPEKGKDGISPVAGLDYPTQEEFAKMIKEMMPKLEKTKMVKLPTIQEIVKGIEGLPEKEKLDYHKGLKNTPTTNEIPSRSISRGGGMGNWEHEEFDTSSATTTITLSKNVAADGSAILLRYNGQLLAHGIQYTISGRIISFTFTLDDNSKVDATFVRK